MADDAIMERLKKLLALSKSSNPHEAALALDRAQKLMREHGITEEAIALSDISESRTDFAFNKDSDPPRFVAMLVEMIGSVFGVSSIYQPSDGGVSFYGPTIRAQLASYTYAVLGRQLRMARKDFMQENWHLRRVLLQNRMDSFAEGWVASVRNKAERLIVRPEERALMKRWLEQNYGKDLAVCGVARPSQRPGADTARASGIAAGRDAHLHAPMNASASRAAIEGTR